MTKNSRSLPFIFYSLVSIRNQPLFQIIQKHLICLLLISDLQLYITYKSIELNFTIKTIKYKRQKNILNDFICYDYSSLSDGNRVSLPEAVILSEKGIDKQLVIYLHDIHHLIRSEPNTTGGLSFELSHDTLVKPTITAKKERE